MNGADKENWMELCEEAAKEENPDRLLHLVRHLNDVLEQKRNRLAEELKAFSAAAE